LYQRRYMNHCIDSKAEHVVTFHFDPFAKSLRLDQLLIPTFANK
jgi:hypothetical protein